MALQQVGKILEELIGVQVVNPSSEIIANPPDGPGIGLNGLGLQPLELQVLLMFAVIPGKGRVVGHVGIHCNLPEWN